MSMRKNIYVTLYVYVSIYTCNMYFSLSLSLSLSACVKDFHINSGSCRGIQMNELEGNEDLGLHD